MSWRFVPGAFDPPTRSVHGMLYAPWLGRVFMMSGNHGTGPSDEFWSWDGTKWFSSIWKTGDCGPRKNFGFAVDDASHRVYAFAGVWSGYKTPGKYEVTILGEFCSFDGTTWKKLSSEGAPEPRAGHAMAFDRERNELVVFGGLGVGNAAFNDTWTFNGTTWTKKVIVGDVPSPRLNMRMVWNPARKTMVLFGGHGNVAGKLELYDDTWEWNGSTWSKLSPAHHPPARGFYGLAWDEKNQRVLMLGGATASPPIPPGDVVDDFWAFDGADWSKIEWPADGNRPAARAGGAITWDSKRGRLLLFAGNGRYEELNDTWDWDGAKWSERTALPTPSINAAFAQNPATGVAFNFGGYVSSGGFELDNAWRFDGTRWLRIPGAGPSGRDSAQASMHGKTAVLFGGINAGLLGDTWTWSEATGWLDQTSASSPPARYSGAMAFDPVRERTVLFGGRTASGKLGDTWEWNGFFWEQKTPAASPPARSGGALRWDPVARQLVLFGGVTADSKQLSDVWAWDGTTWSQRIAPGGPASVSPAVAILDDGTLMVAGGYAATAARTMLSSVSALREGEWSEFSMVPGTGRFGAQWLRTSTGWTLFGGADTDFSSYWNDRSDAWDLRLVRN